MSEQDVLNMRLVLKAKHEQHEEIRVLLRQTGTSIILEDCTRRPHGSGMFWGAAWLDGEWKGENVLGKLWMELRGLQS